jgi:N-dimethylarginine dimethylaminohydrolase
VGLATRKPAVASDYYGIEYEINPWMSRARQADRAEALRQWQALHATLLAAGAKISLIEAVDGLPDLVFTANAGLVYRQQVILSHFRHPQRQREEEYFRRWFQQQGYDVLDPPGGLAFEGAGDALFCGDTLFAGYRMRSDAHELQQIGMTLGCRVIPLELVDPYYYHLDTCPAAFDDYGRRAIRQLVDELIEVETVEAETFACNAVVVGKTVVTNVGCPRFHSALERRGFQAIATPLGEFTKAGGSAKCLTLRLDGEEAAAWRA